MPRVLDSDAACNIIFYSDSLYYWCAAARKSVRVQAAKSDDIGEKIETAIEDLKVRCRQGSICSYMSRDAPHNHAPGRRNSAALDQQRRCFLYVRLLVR